MDLVELANIYHQEINKGLRDYTDAAVTGVKAARAHRLQAASRGHGLKSRARQEKAKKLAHEARMKSDPRYAAKTRTDEWMKRRKAAEEAAKPPAPAPKTWL